MDYFKGSQMLQQCTVKSEYNGPVYRDHPLYYGHRTTSQNYFQLSKIFSAQLTCIQLNQKGLL